MRCSDCNCYMRSMHLHKGRCMPCKDKYEAACAARWRAEIAELPWRQSKYSGNRFRAVIENPATLDKIRKVTPRTPQQAPLPGFKEVGAEALELGAAGTRRTYTATLYYESMGGEILKAQLYNLTAAEVVHVRRVSLPEPSLRIARKGSPITQAEVTAYRDAQAHFFAARQVDWQALTRTPPIRTEHEDAPVEV